MHDAGNARNNKDNYANSADVSLPACDPEDGSPTNLRLGNVVPLAIGGYRSINLFLDKAVWYLLGNVTIPQRFNRQSY